MKWNNRKERKCFVKCQLQKKRGILIMFMEKYTITTITQIKER
jgi:hypothetical protein